MNPLTNFAAQLVEPNTLPEVHANSSSVGHVLAIAFTIFGAIAFLMIVLAGFNYILAQGNPDKVARARSTIIYAAIGLAICASAAFIVTVVLNQSP